MSDTSASLIGTGLSLSLTVKDVATSLRWYVDTLGFSVDHRNEADGVLRTVVLSAGAVRVLLNLDDGAKGWDRIKGAGLALNFATEQDVDAIAARIKSAGYAIDSEPADRPWGARSFLVTDPDGFGWSISKWNRG